MDAPPGLVYLLQRIPYIFAPPLVVFIAKHVAREHVGLPVPAWLVLCGYLLSWPLALMAVVQYNMYKDNRDAAALGATIPVRTKSKWPAGLDTLRYRIADSRRFFGFRHFLWTEMYGFVYNTRVFFDNRIFTSEPDHIKRILATDFLTYEKGADANARLATLLGTGVFNSDGEMWKFHRSMTRPFFSKDRISHFDIFDRHAEDALGQLKNRMKEGHAVDWQDLVSRFTLDSATEFLFGSDVRSLSAGLPYPPNSPTAQSDPSASHPANQFAKAFLQAQLATLSRSFYMSAWPLFEFWKDKVKAHMDVIDGVVKPLVRTALERKVAPGMMADPQLANDETLLGHLVNITDDVKMIKDETLNILLAGRDTTAATLTFAIYALAEHPEVLCRLRQEILSRVGNNRRPTYLDIREMKYLRAFINETLRLFPPVPFNMRATTKSTVWPAQTPGGKPLYIPASTRCTYSVFVMHRRKDLWGPDAAEFDPDRFLDERLAKYLTPNPFIFLPFNAGPRICLGQQFAYNEVSFMLIRLLQQFSSITLVPDANPDAAPPPGWAESRGSNGKENVWIKSHLTMYAQGGLWVKMDAAK